jgi:hypothetical protein
MKEAHLHFLFESGKLGNSFTTNKGQKVKVLDFGYLNLSSGPDFQQTKIKLDKETWAGSIEFHIKSSDWFSHGHQNDKAYENVVLHIVWEHDKDVEINDRILPVIELNKLNQKFDFDQIERFITYKKNLACKEGFKQLSSITIQHQLSTAIQQRLNRKGLEVVELIKTNRGDQLKTILQLLAKAFGGKTNAPAFDQLVNKVEVSFISRLNFDPTKVAALLHGLSGLLPNEKNQQDYEAELQNEFDYQKKLFNLTPLPETTWRRSSFYSASNPSLRIAQFACLLVNILKKPNFYSSQAFNEVLDIQLHPFWETHSSFSKSTIKGSRKLSKDFKSHLTINVIVPFSYGLSLIKDDARYQEMAISTLRQLPAEKNKLIRKWKALGCEVSSAAESQAVIEQFNEFCYKKKCLFCNVGRKLLSQ